MQVRPGHDGRWEVVEPGGRRALATATGEALAIRKAAKELTRGGTIEVLEADGAIRLTLQVPAFDKKPWWYSRPTPFWWVAVVLFLFQSAFGLTTRNHAELLWWGYLVFGLVGVSALVSIVLSRRRDSERARDLIRALD